MINQLSELYIQRLIFTIVAFVITLILSFISKQLIDVLFRGVKLRIASERTLSKTRTIRNLLKNIVDAVLFLTCLLIVLAQWGINIIPLLTGASILGLAVSFGAQTFIKDVIAGFFIITEDQFHIGDKIQVDKLVGVVDNITLRLTVLKDAKGNYIYIPNSQITTLIRYEGK